MIVKSSSPSVLSLLFTWHHSIIPIIWKKLLFTVLLSTLVVWSHGRIFEYKIMMTSAPFTIWGLTLAIFLSFRNSVAYQRYWEARTLWGQLLISSRSFTRQMISFIPQLTNEERSKITNLLIAFIHAFKNQLRGDDALKNLDEFLEKQHIENLRNVHNPANKLLGELGKLINTAATKYSIDNILLANIDNQLNQISTVLGGCERIKNTPIPFPYLLLHRTVHIYCFLLPFFLVDTIGWTTPFAVCFLAYTFFGLDVLGDEISDPFNIQANDLPLDSITRNIEINIKELIGAEAPSPIAAKNDTLL